MDFGDVIWILQMGDGFLMGWDLVLENVIKRKLRLRLPLPLPLIFFITSFPTTLGTISQTSFFKMELYSFIIASYDTISLGKEDLALDIISLDVSNQ